MKPDLLSQASRIPVRQLHLMLGGLLLVAGAGLWQYALRAPLASLRAIQVERSALESGGLDPRLLAAQAAQLDTEVAALSRQLGRGAARPPTAQLMLGLIGEMSALAAVHGVRLNSANPAAVIQTLVFDEIGFDAAASGTYPALLAWLAAIETARPNLAVVRFEMRTSKTAGQVDMNVRVAVYHPQETAR